MDESSLAHELPALYRAVLDRVAELERLRHRREAEVLRADAIRVYSGPWTDGALKSMGVLKARADRVCEGTDRPRQPRTENPFARYLRFRRVTV